MAVRRDCMNTREISVQTGPDKMDIRWGKLICGFFLESSKKYGDGQGGVANTSEKERSYYSKNVYQSASYDGTDRSSGGRTKEEHRYEIGRVIREIFRCQRNCGL